jgi:hypothetical protein
LAPRAGLPEAKGIKGLGCQTSITAHFDAKRLSEPLANPCRAPPDPEIGSPRTVGTETEAEVQSVVRRTTPSYRKIVAHFCPPTPINSAASRIVIEATASRRKWTARLDDRVLWVTASPFVKSARLLLDEGYSANAVIEMWRPNTDEWALRGRLGAVAATIMDGDTSSHCAKSGFPARDPEQGGNKKPAAGLRSSSGGSRRAEASKGEVGEAAQRTMSQKRLGPSAGDAEAMKIAPNNRSFPTKSPDGSPSHFHFTTPRGRWRAGAVRS